MSILKAVEITSAIPIIFHPIMYNNKYYIDAGLVEHLPIKYCNINTTLGFVIKCNNIKIDSLFSVMSAAIAMSIDHNITKYNVVEIILNDLNALDFNINYDNKMNLINIDQ